jgi:6-pyruvoyltetrahydropterin/6-carboxytetrahydropterin synthase
MAPNVYQISKKISFCYGHRLLNYNGKCANLHGHNGLAVITIEAPQLNELGMVMDFGEIKATVSKWIDTTLDHRMLLHKDDPILPYMHQLNEPVFIMNDNPTAENIARVIFEFAASQGYRVTEVKLWETPSSCAVYTNSGSIN